MKELKNNFLLHPSKPISGGEYQQSPVAPPGGDGVSILIDEIRALKKEILEIKKHFHVGEPAPRLLDIKVLAKREARAYRREKR